RTFRLRGKGLPKTDGRGDLYVSIDIQLPADDDGELAALMRRMKAQA
ncbi:MAG: J domain-containing protein, partial [Beijerinckiaceae bacterium]